MAYHIQNPWLNLDTMVLIQSHQTARTLLCTLYIGGCHRAAATPYCNSITIC
jgi:hypothetical protein